MKTLGQRLREKKRAAIAGTSPAADARASDQQELMLAALWQHRQQLKSIQSIERKVDYKREHLADFAAYVDGTLQADTGAPDDVLMTIMIWRFDVADLAGALAIGEYALRHGLAAPDRFQRSLAAIIVESTADEAIARLAGDDAGAGLAELINQLDQVNALTADADMHDQVRAKLHKALGYAYRQQGDAATALAQLQRALNLNAHAGVKKDIERLRRTANKQDGG